MLRTGIVVGMLAALAMAWWLWSAETDVLPNLLEAAAPPGAEATSPAQQPLAEPASARASGQDGVWWAQSLTTPEAAVVEADESDERSGVLRGRLTVRQQPWEHPAAVQVRLTRSWLDSVIPVETDSDVRAPQRDELITTSDVQGRFAFRIVPPATELFFLIGHGTEWQDYQKVPKLPRAGEAVDLGDVWLDQRGEIVGHLELTNGLMNFQGTTVRAVDDPLLDGTSGFEEECLGRRRGLEQYDAHGTMRGGPVPDWVARRDGFLPFPVATADREGNFRLRGVRPGNHNLFVSNPGMDVYGRSEGVLVAAGRTTNVGAVRVTMANMIRLRFVDEDKKPWVGAQVAMLHDEIGFGAGAKRTDVRGSVFLPRTGSGGRLLFAMTAGGPWLEFPLPQPGRDTAHDSEAIVVPRPRELTVELVDAGNRRLTGGTVRSYVQVSEFRLVDRLVPSGMQPRQREDGVHVGQMPCPLVLVASVPGFAPATAVTREPNVTMTLLPLQSATVRVHTLRGDPVAGAVVSAQVHANPDLLFCGAQWPLLANARVRAGTTDEHGELVIQVWPTVFSFQARHRDFAPTAGPRILPLPGQVIDLLLLGGGDVHGTLTIESQPAPAGLRVRARQCPPKGHPLETSGFLDERTAVTGKDGTFAFRQLVAGIWELDPELPPVPTANGPRAAPRPFQTTRVQLDEGQDLYVAMEIQSDYLAPMQINGTVTQNGATVPGALVRLRELDPPGARIRNEQRHKARRTGDRDAVELLGPDEAAPWKRCQTDAFGDYRFRELAVGVDYELRVDIPEGGRLQFVGRRVVRPGTAVRPSREDFALSTSDVRITCLMDGRPLPDRMLRLRQIVDKDIEGARFELLLDAFGQAWVEALPVGSWTIEPMHGGRCEPGQFEVVANTPSLPMITVLRR